MADLRRFRWLAVAVVAGSAVSACGSSTPSTVEGAPVSLSPTVPTPAPVATAPVATPPATAPPEPARTATSAATAPHPGVTVAARTLPATTRAPVGAPTHPAAVTTTTFPAFPPGTNYKNSQTVSTAISGPASGHAGQPVDFTGYIRYSAQKPQFSGFCVNTSATPCDIGSPPPNCPIQTSIPASPGTVVAPYRHTFSSPGTYVVHFVVFTGCQYWLGAYTSSALTVSIS